MDDADMSIDNLLGFHLRTMLVGHSLSQYATQVAPKQRDNTLDLLLKQRAAEVSKPINPATTSSSHQTKATPFVTENDIKAKLLAQQEELRSSTTSSETGKSMR